MATREQELQNLKIMQGALSKIRELEETLNDEENALSYQYNREVEDYPHYIPSRFKEEAEEETAKSSAITRKILSSIVSGSIPLVFIIKEFLALPPSEYTLGAEFIVLAIPPILVGFIPFFGGAIAALMQFLAWLLWKGPDMNFVFTSTHGKENALIFLLSLGAGWIVVLIASAILSPVNKKKIAAAAKQDAKHKAAYDQKKAVAEIEIAKQRKALAEEVEEKANEIRQRISELKEELHRQITLLAKTPGLADQDKNSYTVNTLITYFERGRVDSIKEAINLYIAEQRASDHDRAMARMESQRLFALEQMRKEQEEHNERMRKKAQEVSDEVEKLIDDIKYGK